MERPEDGSKPQGMGPEKSTLALYLKVAAPIFFGLFLLEYPPLFLFGYWTWSGTLHKILSGIFLILNLAVAEYAVRRRRARLAARAGRIS